MKALLLLLIGIVIGGYAMRVYDDRHPAQSSIKDAASDRLAEWHLMPDDIKADLAKTGRVVRAKAAIAGDKVADGRILTMIKAKYVLDRDLSARDISVDVSQGSVTLSGTVASSDLVGRAVALALDTHGVQNVDARLTVDGR